MPGREAGRGQAPGAGQGSSACCTPSDMPLQLPPPKPLRWGRWRVLQGRPIPSVRYTPGPISNGRLSLHRTSNRTSMSLPTGTHRAMLRCPLPAEMTLHVFRGEEVTETEWAAEGRVTRGTGSSLGPAPAEMQILGPSPPTPPSLPLQQPSPGPALPTGVQPFPPGSRPHSLVQLQVQSEVGVEGWDDETHLGQVDRLGVGRGQREGQPGEA